MSHRLSYRGFTLIELLIVIAVIAVLVALILPSIRRVREQALKVQCMSNQRQVVLASLAYHMDWRKFPNTDGSWLDRVKSNPNSATGIGVLAVKNYLKPSRSMVAGTMFCPAASPSWNWRQPGHVSIGLSSGYSNNNELYTTYVGKFCTFVGYNTTGQPDRANLTIPLAQRMSPILVADYWFGNTAEQGHESRGVCAAFVDGSAQWIDAADVARAGYTMSNRNPYSNFWYYARKVHGDKK